MMLFDAHLDLAYNAVRGRDLLRPADAQTPDADGIPSVGLPDLQAAEVRWLCGTIFVEPASDRCKGGYRTPDEAHLAAVGQLDWYQDRFAAADLRLIRSAADLAAEPVPGVILLMEGADPIRHEEDLQRWHAAGLRAVGLAWRKTRLAGGTGQSGGLSEEGRRLLRHLDARGIIHDASHLAEQAFWELLEQSAGPVMASHSNCRALVPTDRQLSDDMIRAIARRGGVIGINLFGRFLTPPDAPRRATLDDVVVHLRHVCEVLGNARHVGIGSDMDGGFGADHLPVGVRTHRDLSRLAERLVRSGFTDAEVRDIFCENWLRFFRSCLP